MLARGVEFPRRTRMAGFVVLVCGNRASEISDLGVELLLFNSPLLSWLLPSGIATSANSNQDGQVCSLFLSHSTLQNREFCYTDMHLTMLNCGSPVSYTHLTLPTKLSV